PTIIAALFLLLIRRTPTSTLFPYTTLFRSVFQCGIALAVGKAGDQIGADAVIHTHGEMVGFQIVADFKSGLVLVAIDLGTVNKHAEAAGLFAGSATDVAIQAIDGSGICAVVSAGLATATQVMADIADLVGTQLNQ